MSKARERKTEQGMAPGSVWLTPVLDLLRGGALGFVVSCCALGVAAFLIYSGVMGYGKADGAIVAACLLGGFSGGVFAVKRWKRAPLPLGVGTGLVLFLVLMAAGSILYDAALRVTSAGITLCACLCGGGLAGFMGGAGKRSRRK